MRGCGPAFGVRIYCDNESWAVKEFEKRKSRIDAVVNFVKNENNFLIFYRLIVYCNSICTTSTKFVLKPAGN